MQNFIYNFYKSNKEYIPLYLQAFATMAIGLLAWVAACGQNNLALKKERRDLFKLRYENIYKVTNRLFVECDKLSNMAGEIHYCTIFANNSPGLTKEQKLELEKIKYEYELVSENYEKTIQANKFLIKTIDYDILYTFCNEYKKRIKNWIHGKADYSNIYGTYRAYYNEHYEKISKILDRYLQHENESKITFYLYKFYKYLRANLRNFIKDYFPTYWDILTFPLLFLCTVYHVNRGLSTSIKKLLKKDILKKETII